MNLENAEGIIIYPSVRKFTNYRGIISSLPTMMMRLAVINEGIVDVQGGSEASYLKTIEPCPMVCGNMINYLVTPE